MARTSASIDTRVRALESRADRHNEDITVLVSTGSETLTRVKKVATAVRRLQAEVGELKTTVGELTTRVGGLDGRVRRVERGVDAIAAHLGVEIPAEDAGD